MNKDKSLCLVKTSLGCERVVFDSTGLALQPRDRVVVESAGGRGQELGRVIQLNPPFTPESGGEALRRVVRTATENDLREAEANQKKADEAFLQARTKVAEHKLPMRLVKAEYQLDRSKLTIYFTAENRVDFRALVRDLAQLFKTRIELRQIGVRDESRILTGEGTCGQELCCCRWLSEFKPVSIKMAKEQSLALSPQKISGVCGRLLCCLTYEVDQYKEMKAEMPRVGEKIEYNGKPAKISRVFLLKQAVEVQYEDGSTEMLAVDRPEEE